VDRALDVNAELLALGNDVFEADGARFVRNRDTPHVWDSNHVSHVAASTPEAIDTLIARAEREFDGMDSLSFHTDYRTPPQFEARLTLNSYERHDNLVMLLEGELAWDPNPSDIRPVESDLDWAAYTTLFRIDWGEYREKASKATDAWLVDELMTGRRQKSPKARFWMAYINGEPRAYLLSWEGSSGVGQVEDLFTHPDSRHQGLATALIHHGVADARSRGAGPVVIVAEANDTPKMMYAAMGFRPVALKRTWRRQLSGAR
jgi:ribosomal protein S18 acetylase RimI-like enzyme